jgi:hypothetical protein
MNNLARLVSQVFGVILTLVGLMGFIPALTPTGQLLGIFAIKPGAQPRVSPDRPARPLRGLYDA